MLQTLPLGDFEDKNTGIDYGYDANGNMVTDKNKRLNGTTDLNIPANAGAIQYNHLNLPWMITVKDDTGNDKGTITYVYDATGNKIEKRVEELASTTNNQTGKNTSTTYLGSFVYENNVLKFFGQEEGRIRPERNGENGIITGYAYDYFVKDHLGNVRAVLSDKNSKGASYIASLEDASRNIEQQLFDKIPETVADKPAGFDSDNANAKVSKLSGVAGADKRIGPGVVLKVMKGDKFRAAVKAWCLPGTDASQDPGLGSMVSSLASAFIGGLPSTGGTHGLGAALQSSGAISVPMTGFLNTVHDNSGTVPKAYLNWMVLDEQQFELVDGNHGASQVPTITGMIQKQILSAGGGADIEVKKSGYLYVYVSNESRGNVYFDDLSVVHTAGGLLEETHYYPFGLTMAGISSKAAGRLENKSKYVGQILDDDFGLALYQFRFRNHDPQLGRFIEIDPLASDYVHNSTYAYAENKPINGIDLEGLEFFQTTNRQYMLGDTRVTELKTKILINVINSSTLNADQLSQRLNSLKLGAERVMSFSQDAIAKDGTKIQARGITEIEFIQSSNYQDNPFVLELVDNISGLETGSASPSGNSQSNDLRLAVGAELNVGLGMKVDNPVSEQSFTLAHELGHAAGLKHTGYRGQLGLNADETDKNIMQFSKFNEKNNNFMIQGGNQNYYTAVMNMYQYLKMSENIKQDVKKK